MPLARPKQDAGRILEPRHDSAQAGAVNLVDPAEEIDHCIEIVHAGRGHRPGRRLLRVGPPIILDHREPSRRCLRALAMTDGAETAVC